MEINISRQRIKSIALVTVVVASLITCSLYFWKTDILGTLLKPYQPEPVIFDLPLESKAIMAVARMYAPDATMDKEVWQKQVCGGMTEEGCQLFQSTYAPVIWASAQTKPIGADQVKNIKKIEDGDGGHFWKLSMVVFEGKEGEHYTEHNFDVYAQVSRTESGEWLLERILFDDEVQARYGSKKVISQ
jgi:NAD-dependent oxidoreductase involved in siderophore biosynthesis